MSTKMTDLILNLPDENTLTQCAKRLAPALTGLSGPTLLTFSGEIGAGKTTFIRALLKTMGVTGTIKSPTFSLVESYLASALHLHHFDLYRIHDEEELEYVGFRDYFSSQSICLIEWPEHASVALPRPDLTFLLTIEGIGRMMNIHANTPVGDYLLEQLCGD